MGIECCFAIGSWTLANAFNHYVALKSDEESLIYYAYSAYLAYYYFTLALCNPGRLTWKQKDKVNKKVSLLVLMRHV